MKDPDLIFFGGTFDPPHNGHYQLLKAVRELYRNAKIAIVPSFQPPLNADNQKAISTAFESRLEMCALAFHEFLDKDLCFISNMEQSLPKPSYTIKTLQALQKQYYPQRKAILIGQDQLGNLKNWYEAASLLNELDIIVATRSEKKSFSERQAECLKAITDLTENLELGHFQASPGEVLFPNRSLRFIFLKEVHVSVSSTLIRKNIETNSVDKNLIDASVHRYSIENKLYTPQEK